MLLSFLLLSLAAADSAISAGHYEEGFQKAKQAAAEFLQSADLKGQSRAFNMMGNARYYLGDYPNAIVHYTDALATARKAQAADIEINALNNLGNVHYFLGEYAEAWQSYEQAAETVERHPSEPWAERLRLGTGVNQATLLQRVGKDNEAMRIYRRIRESASKLPTAGQGQFLANLGALFRRLGDPVKSMELYRRALDLFEAAKSNDGVITTLKNMGIAQAIEFQDLPAARKSFVKAQQLAEKSGNKPQFLQTQLYLAEVASRAGQPQEARKLWTASLNLAQELKAKEDQWKALYGLGRLKEAVEVIESLRPTIDRGEFLSAKRTVYDAYIASLPDNPADLFYWIERIRARRFRDNSKPIQLDAIQTLLQEQEMLISCWINKCVWIGKHAAGVVASPLKLSPNSSKRLILVPDVNSPVSEWDQGLLDRYEVSYLPTASLLRKTESSPSWRARALIVAGVNPKSARGLAGDSTLPNLPHSLDEVKSIERDFTGSVTQMKSAFQNSASQFAVLHLATHAIADHDDPQRSRLLFSDAPLYLSEIEKLNLTGVQLATLSACRTAEGSDSLAYGFLRAGAQSVVATLWPVNDQAAAEFMKQFYAALGRGESKVQALRTAKFNLRNSEGAMHDVQYWGAFVLYGDADGQIVRPVPWLWIAAVIAGCVALTVRFRKSQA